MKAMTRFEKDLQRAKSGDAHAVIERRLQEIRKLRADLRDSKYAFRWHCLYREYETLIEQLDAIEEASL